MKHRVPGFNYSVGVVTVATNRYLDYWLDMALSAERHLFIGHEVVMHVFTDRVAQVNSMKSQFSRISIHAVQVEELVWPEATLLRYEIFDAHREFLKQDVLMHLDADMALVDDVGLEFEPGDWPGGIALVLHPGFRRPNGSSLLALYKRRPRILIQDLVAKTRFGAVGSWETNPSSRAFVSRNLRQRYFCGGTWMGLRDPFLLMIHELAERVRKDLDEGTIATWHDESHLNWFASKNKSAILGSEYCYAPNFPNLADLQPRIIAVEKGDERTR
jgi:histo-blood group ABO system transferase